MATINTAFSPFATRDANNILKSFSKDDREEFQCVVDMVNSLEIFISKMDFFRKIGLIKLNNRVNGSLLGRTFSPAVYSDLFSIELLDSPFVFGMASIRNRRYGKIIRAITIGEKEERKVVLLEYFKDSNPLTLKHPSIRRARYRAIACIKRQNAA